MDKRTRSECPSTARRGGWLNNPYPVVNNAEFEVPRIDAALQYSRLTLG